jgi:hypothetical protein
MSETFMTLLFVESVLTAATALLFAYRGMLDMKEEDHLILHDAESHLARDQAAIRHKVTWLTKYIRVFGSAWGVLAVVLVSLWIAEGLNLV